MIVLHRDKKSVRSANNPLSRGKYATNSPLLERTLSFLLAPSLVNKMTTMNSDTSSALSAVPVEYFSFLSSAIAASYGSHTLHPNPSAKLAELSQRVLTLLSTHVSSELSSSSPPDSILCGLLDCLRTIMSLDPAVLLPVIIL
jgi:hypothetical protein